MSALFLHLQLLHPDDHKRLRTADSMRKHAFFKDISWDEVEKKTIVPSFVPPVSQSALEDGGMMCLGLDGYSLLPHCSKTASTVTPLTSWKK